MKRLALATLLIALLSGCADTPTEQASIEDRAIATEAAKAAADAGKTDTGSRVYGPIDPASTRPDGRPGIDEAPLGERAVAGERKTDTPVDSGARATVTPQSIETVRTQPLETQTTEIAAIDPATSGVDATGSEAATEASAVAQAVAQARAGLRDPANVLSQRRIHFDYDSAAIRDEYRAVLEAHAEYLRTDKEAKALLQGHADERGSREYNLALGQRRAESVYRALNLLGVDENQIEAVSLGEEKPLVEGQNEEAWAQNRRVEIYYQGE